MSIFNIFKKKKLEKKPKKETKKKISKTKKPVPKKRTEKVYKILKNPHISEKSTQLTDLRKYAFKIYPHANKNQVKKAIRDLYGVDVKNVNIINIKPKKRLLRGIEGKKKGYKKAVVTLEKGQKIEVAPH